MRNMQNWAHLHAVFSVPHLTTHHTHIGSRPFNVGHSILIPSMCRRPWFSSSPFTSPCTSPSSSCPSSPCTPTPTLTPWQPITCATPPMGPSSPPTIPPSTQVTSPTTWSSLTRSSSTWSPATSSTSRFPSSTLLRRQNHCVDEETLGKLLAEVHRDYADYRRPEGVCVSPSFCHGRSNGKTCGKEWLRSFWF